VNIQKKHWLTFAFFAILSLICWHRFSYPQLAFTEFAITRDQALSIAKNYLEKECQEDTSDYMTAVVFEIDEGANRFLQRTLGFKGLVEFVQTYDFDMFYWIVRFFKEQEKEEYRVIISSATGEIITFSHIIEDTRSIEIIERDVAREKAKQFLNERFGFDPKEYYVKGDLKSNYDFRSDYSFTYRKKDVAIFWSEAIDAGFGKLITSVKISGDHILSFSKNGFLVPDEFNREISRLKNTGDNLMTIVRVFFTFLFVASIYFVIARRDHLAMHTTKKFYIIIVLISFSLSLLALVNQYQSILYGYSTTSPLLDYLMRLSITAIISGLFITVALLMPGLSGELLHFEQQRERREGAFLHYVRTTFFSRTVAQAILLGYLVCIIMLGIQSIIIEVGQNHWGVWREYSWVTQLTTAYIPLLAAFTIGFKSSFSEELMFRLFALNLGKKFFKNVENGLVLIDQS